MIEARDICVSFHSGTPLETAALRKTSFRISRGEFVTVIGSNGAGKSTLLNVLAGDILPNSGNIFLDGKNATSLPPHRRAGVVARVFQDPLAGTCADLTIEENMSLAAARGRRRGWRLAVNDSLRARFRERLSPLGLGLESRLGEKVGRLSGGQRQALSLIMSVLETPRVLLLDEHTAALDPRMAAFVLRLTRELGARHKMAILMVTHSLSAALACGTRTLMLHQGKIALDVAGDTRRAMHPPDLLKLFAQNAGEEADDDRLLLG